MVNNHLNVDYGDELKMCNYINSLLQIDQHLVVIEDPNDKTLDLGNFYGQDLDGYFEHY
jgi:hypothetical protein